MRLTEKEFREIFREHEQNANELTAAEEKAAARLELERLKIELNRQKIELAQMKGERAIKAEQQKIELAQLKEERHTRAEQERINRLKKQKKWDNIVTIFSIVATLAGVVISGLIFLFVVSKG